MSSQPSWNRPYLLPAVLLAVALAGSMVAAAPRVLAQAVSVGTNGPYTAAVGQPILMSGSVGVLGVVPTQWTWSIGDGTAASGQTVQTTDIAPGSYTVTLQVETSQGTASATTTATIRGQVLSGQASAGGPYSGTVGQPITMSGSVGVLGVSPSEWHWSFGDGTTGLGQTVQKTYATPGTYVVTLQVRGVGGFPGTFTASTTATITFGAAGTTAAAALVTGCNNVASTWPDQTPPSAIAAAVGPPGTVGAIWRYDTTTGRFLGYAPLVTQAANDLLVVNRFEALFICTTSPATLTRPPLR